MDAPILCQITRFGLTSARHLLPMYRDYRRVAREAEATGVPGLLRSAFLVENPRTCYTLSLWSEPPTFSADVPGHIDAARRGFGRVSVLPGSGAELWSTKWKLVSVTNNLRWPGLDLRSILVEGGA